MPTISKFYGITITMFFKESEHNPPHFHAFYKNDKAQFNIKTLKLMSGKLPHYAMKLVQKWAKKHKSELLGIWEEQRFTKIEPLQ